MVKIVGDDGFYTRDAVLARY